MIGARRTHRALGLALALPLFVWTVTGLFFLVKPGWRGAYEPLDAARDEFVDTGAVVPLAAAVAAVAAAPADSGRPASVSPASTLPGAPSVSGGAVTRVELLATALGPLYRLRVGGASRLVNARTGVLRSPLSAPDAATLALDAASRAKARARYGAVTSSEVAEDAVTIRFAGGAVVTVGRNDLEIAQRGRDTDRIDLFYRLHYLQWTGRPAIDRPLALAGIIGVWALAGAGLWLAKRKAAGAAG